jgi:hypothetical protein
LKRTTRPAHCEPGSITDARELGERLRASRERLAASDLAKIGRAWRLWAVCADATFGYSRAADQTYATSLGRKAGIDRWAASEMLRRFDELGVFGWRAAPRGSHAISELSLPPLTWSGDHVSDVHVVSTPPVDAPTRGLGTTLQSNELSVMAMSDAASAGTHRSSVIGSSDSGSEDWHAERRAIPEIGPARCATPGCDGIAFSEDFCIECDRKHFYEAERFASFHGDERTTDGVGDDEAAQLRWQSANPSKTRVRRKRN